MKERARVVSRSGDDSIESIDGSVTRFCLQQSVTTLCTESGRKIEVPGHLSADQEYDVEITVTPRRWAPKGYHWEGDELHRTRSGRVWSTAGCSPPGLVERCCGPVPAEVFRAFEKAGLLK